jgi:hypothetical protein
MSRTLAPPSGALRRRSRSPRPAALPVAVTLVLLLLVGVPLGADSEEERRAQTGVRLFRALLAADLALEQKRLGDGSLLLLVVYGSDRRLGEDLARAMRGTGADPDPIRNLPVVVETAHSRQLEAFRERVPAGIFLAQPADARAIEGFVRFGVEHRVVVYSPFEGDVERGVHAGISVEAQVRPYLNTATLEASGIELKPFFLKVAKFFP